MSIHEDIEYTEYVLSLLLEWDTKQNDGLNTKLLCELHDELMESSHNHTRVKEKIVAVFDELKLNMKLSKDARLIKLESEMYALVESLE
jgi:hypothetical protein